METQQQTHTEKTQVCNECNKELPLTEFMKTRSGKHMKVCRGCRTKKVQQTWHQRKENETQRRIEKLNLDTEFDNMSIGDVTSLIGRAKKWLELRGYKIQISGVYRETRPRKLKFN